MFQLPLCQTGNLPQTSENKYLKPIFPLVAAFRNIPTTKHEGKPWSLTTSKEGKMMEHTAKPWGDNMNIFFYVKPFTGYSPPNHPEVVFPTHFHLISSLSMWFFSCSVTGKVPHLLIDHDRNLSDNDLNTLGAQVLQVNSSCEGCIIRADSKRCHLLYTM